MLHLPLLLFCPLPTPSPAPSPTPLSCRPGSPAPVPVRTVELRRRSLVPSLALFDALHSPYNARYRCRHGSQARFSSPCWFCFFYGRLCLITCDRTSPRAYNDVRTLLDERIRYGFRTLCFLYLACICAWSLHLRKSLRICCMCIQRPTGSFSKYQCPTGSALAV